MLSEETYPRESREPLRVGPPAQPNCKAWGKNEHVPSRTEHQDSFI